MLNKFNFEEIITQAKELGLPGDQKRNILREYLQCRFLGILYSLKNSHKLIFIGGTSLRLLHGLDRFSEDLDFDNEGLTPKQIKQLVEETLKQLEKEDFDIELSFKSLKNNGSFKIKFLKTLFAAEITNNPREKLMIKFDYARRKIRSERRVFVLGRFGVAQRIPSYPLKTLLSYKMIAIKTRKRALVRDFYDVAWILSKSVKPNLAILNLKSEKKFYEQLKRSFLKKIKPRLSDHKKLLSRFLIDPEKVRLLDLFEELIESKLA